MDATLYHFTCEHGRRGIEELKQIVPKFHPLVGVELAWFTDLADPGRDVVGLTSDTLDCDRLAFRFEVDASVCRPWLGSIEQAGTPVSYQMDLHRYSEPAHWWISAVPVPIVEALVAT